LTDLGAKAAAGGRKKAHHEDRNLQARPQTRAKLDAYCGYLPRYLGKLGNTSRHVFVNDLFAGSGRVRDGLGWADGSPIIACRLAVETRRKLAARGRDVMFSLRFVELEDERCRTLERLVAPFRNELDIVVYGGKASAFVDRILAESAGFPTFTFIDPDGIGVQFEHVVAFARQFGEVLLDFDLQGVLRTAAIKAPKRVTEFCGGDWWQQYQQNGVFDEDGFLRDYGRRLGPPHFHYVSAHRLDFPAVVANRVIVQGAYSAKALDLWHNEIERAMPRTGGLTLDFVSALDRQTIVAGVIDTVRSLAPRTCTFGAIRGAMGVVPHGEDEIHQALLYLREQGYASWTSTLHADSRPAPQITIYRVPVGITWDGAVREPEKPYRLGGRRVPAAARR
jgi:three-Cys-motif partner protein